MDRNATNRSSAPSPAYLAVNAAIWVVYGALVISVTTVLRFSNPAAAGICVLIVAGLLYPLVRRAERAAKRRFG
jgi:hypothetical protein